MNLLQEGQYEPEHEPEPLQSYNPATDTSHAQQGIVISICSYMHAWTSSLGAVITSKKTVQSFDFRRVYVRFNQNYTFSKVYLGLAAWGLLL